MTILGQFAPQYVAQIPIQLSQKIHVFSKNKENNNQFVSKKSLDCIQIVIKYLKQHASFAGMFQVGGQRLWITKISKLILHGNSYRLSKILDEFQDEIILEVASALRSFLLNLREPLIPAYIQALVLGDNSYVGSEIVARDVLGLIQQDVKGRQGQLLKDLLELLYYVSKNSSINELNGSYMPVQMLPIFFQLTFENLTQWRRIATIFEEIIREAPRILNINIPLDIQSNDVTPHQVFRFSQQHPIMVASDSLINRVPARSQESYEHVHNSETNQRIEVNFIYSQFIFYNGNSRREPRVRTRLHRPMFSNTSLACV